MPRAADRGGSCDRQHQQLLRRNEYDRLLHGNGVNMAKTNAERQAEYRARMRAADGERLNVVVSAEAKQALVSLAEGLGLTQRETLEKVILDASKEHGRAG